MHEPFIVPVVYQGTEHEFKARFERWGYTHRIAVLINEATVTFEPDEEGGYRALNLTQEHHAANAISTGLLEVVSEKLRTLIN